MPATAPSVPAPLIAKPPLSELDVLRAQIARLTQALESVTGQSVTPKAERPAPVYAKEPWAEMVWVEALQRGYYPQPGDTYAICRNGPIDGHDERGRPERIRGSIFRLKHREHLCSWMQEVDPNDPDVRQVPDRQVPQTTARSQNRQSPFPPIQ